MIGPLLWQAWADRQRFIAWVNSPLSEEGRRYRIEALAAAYGLQADYIERIMLPPVETCHGLCYTTSMGRNLMADMLAWMDDHPDLNQNLPLTDDDITMFATMKLG